MPFASIIAQITRIVLALCGISFIVGFHELGHFLFCKLFGVRTPSFSIGFGPRLFKKKIGDTEFSLSAIPLGGYVEIAGIEEVGQGEQKEAKRSDKHSFSTKPYYQKILILGGGILFNLIFAFTTLSILFTFGIPKTPFLYPTNAIPVIKKIAADSPAKKACLQQGDELLKLAGQKIDSQNIIGSLVCIMESAQEKTHITIKRDSQTLQLPITLDQENFKHRLGVSFEVKEIPAQSFMQSIKSALHVMRTWARNTFTALGGMVKKRTVNGMGGPIAIIAEITKSVQSGAIGTFILLCFISVSLAVLNVLPLPIFDGGQALFYTLEAIIGRSLDDFRIYIHYASWFLVVILMLYLSYRDVVRIYLSFCQGT